MREIHVFFKIECAFSTETQTFLAKFLREERGFI